MVLAEGVGSAFCPLSLSRRLRLFAPPALPVTRARARSAPTHVTEHGEAGLLQRTIASDATYAVAGNRIASRGTAASWAKGLALRTRSRGDRCASAGHATLWRGHAHLAPSAVHSGWGGRLAEADHREQRDVLRTRKRIGRREIRGPGAKTPLLDRRRHVAERCVSRVVELVRGSKPASPA